MTNLLRRRTYFLALTSLSIVTSGCGGQPAVNATAPASAASAANAETPATATTQTPDAPLTAEAPSEPQRSPATAAEAAKVLDLRTFPRLESATVVNEGTLAKLNYQAKTDSKTAYEFQRKTLLAQGWKELPGSSVTPEYASGLFQRDGFRVSVSIFPGMDEKKQAVASIAITNHGNVNTQQLPVPAGAKVMYQLPTGTAYVTEQPVDATAAALRKLLTEQGWEPYGQHGDSLVFKQNAVELSARVLAAPGQGGKTVIDFSLRQLSVDLPAPPDAENVRYSEPPTQLSLDVASDQDAVVKYYVERLAKLGWKPTTEKPLKVDFRNELIFRNGEKDLLELAMHDFEGKTRVRIEYQTAEFVAELERRSKAAALAAIEKKKQAENAPLPKVAIKLPAGAKQLSNEKGSLEFSVEVGQAKATVEAIQKQLVANGWEAQSSELEAMFGNVVLKKGDQSMTLVYVETGVLAPEITVRALGMEIETTK